MPAIRPRESRASITGHIEVGQIRLNIVPQEPDSANSEHRMLLSLDNSATGALAGKLFVGSVEFEVLAVTDGKLQTQINLS